MKFLCDACSRLVPVRDFSLRDGALIVACPECKAESRVPAPEFADRKPAPVLELAHPKPPPEGPLCPKCGAQRPAGQEACARCGLVFALFRPENLALPPPLEARWSELQAHWADAELHDAFLDACASADVLTEAARRYRVQAEHAPGDSTALRYRDESARRLLALTSLPLKHDAPCAPSTRARALYAVVFVVFTALFAYAFFRLFRAPPPLP